MQKDIQSAFLDLVIGHRRSSKGWINLNCPSCGDARGRFGIMATPTGGFRARCFNGACPWNDSPTGWEPGGGLGGRPRKLFEALGGDVRDLPIDALLRKSDTYDGSGRQVLAGEKPATRFDDVPLPDDCMPLEDAYPETESAERGLSACIDYAIGLGDEIADSVKLMWSPKHPLHVILPYTHHGRTVGWMGRKAIPGKDRFIGTSPPDFMYRQDTLERTDARSAILVEGVMDAAVIRGVASRGASLTKKQELLLNICGQNIIALPDWSTDGVGLIDAAQRNGWQVSVPDWDIGVKDATEAARRYGILYAIDSIVSSATRDYFKARLRIKLRTK
jgi:hypothetical protein